MTQAKLMGTLSALLWCCDGNGATASSIGYSSYYYSITSGDGCVPSILGNGWCDMINNNAACGT